MLGLGFCGMIWTLDASYVGYVTLFQVVFSACLPFRAQLKGVKGMATSDLHWFAVGGCAVLILCDLYLCLPKDGFKLNAATVFKATAIFLGIFSLLFLLCPTFLLESNFETTGWGTFDGTLDEWHIFVCTGLGCLGLFYCALLWMVDAEAYLAYQTVFMCIFSGILPFYAQAFLPVKMPDHLFPVGGCAVLCLAYIYLLATK
eukprot:SAG22_NODE_1671_length_3847_cov_7.686766_2_plen_202_part_00